MYLTSIRAINLQLLYPAPVRPQQPHIKYVASHPQNSRQSQLDHFYHFPKCFLWLSDWDVFAVSGLALGESGCIVWETDLNGSFNTFASILSDLRTAEVVPHFLSVFKDTPSLMLSPSKRLLGIREGLLKIFNGTLKHEIYPNLLEITTYISLSEKIF